MVEAWVRPLNDVVRLEMRKIRQRRDAFDQQTRNQFDVGDVKLRFRGDKADVELGVDQLELWYHEDREQTAQFITAIRAHTGL